MKYIFTAICLFVLSGSAVCAKQLETFELNYEVYAGGLHGVSTSLEIAKNSLTAYHIKTTVKTRGIISLIYPLKATYVSFGKIKKNELLPEKYESVSKVRSKTKIKTLEYNDKGVIIEKVINKNGKINRTEIIDTKLAEGAIDFLAVWQEMMLKVENGKGCSQEIPVFDGKRRFNLNFKDKGESEILKSKYSFFKGIASECMLDVEPIGERPRNSWFWHRSGKYEKQNPIRIFMASVEENTPPIPVRIEIDSNGFGSIIAHLSSVDFKKKLIHEQGNSK